MLHDPPRPGPADGDPTAAPSGPAVAAARVDRVRADRAHAGPARPGLARPGPPQPGTTRFGWAGVRAGDAGATRSGAGHPGSEHPDAAHRGSAHPVSEHSGAGWPRSAHSGARHSGTGHSGTGHPGSARPGATRSGAAHPEPGLVPTARGGSAHSGATHSGANHSGGTHPGAARFGRPSPGTPRPASLRAPRDAAPAHPGWSRAVAAPFRTEPALLAIAHGSRDARHAATVAALVARIRDARPGLRVEVAYLDHCAPSVPDALAALAADGVRDAVAVPLLLSSAYHAKHDVPALLATGRQLRLTVHTAPALGPHALLLDAHDRRLRALGVRPGDPSYGIVLAAAGSTDRQANADLTALARSWRRTGWGGVTTAFASAGSPAVADAVRDLRRTGLHHIAVATHMLAPGFLPDRIARQSAQAGASLVTAPLADTPELATLALHRYDTAAIHRILRSA